MDLRTFLDSTGDVIGSLAPSLIGSAAAQAWKTGLSWRERFVQWIVGSTVSYYASTGVIALTGWSEFVAQSIAFGIALVAFDATPRIIRATSDVLTEIPARLADRYLGKKD